MRLTNGMVGGIGPAVPESLSEKIRVVVDCELTVEESNVFGAAFRCLEAYLQNAGDHHPNAFATVIFTDKDEVSFTFNPKETGCYTPVIYYPMHHIRAYGYTGDRLLGLALEELCHCFLMERDEGRVKSLIYDSARSFYPLIRLVDLLPPDIIDRYIQPSNQIESPIP